MKKSLLMLLSSAALLSFTTIIQNNFIISGKAAGMPDGANVFLEKQDPVKGFVKVDSAKIKDGKFTFTGNAAEPSIHFIKMGTTDAKAVFVLEKGNIVAEMYKDSVSKSRFTGTSNNADLNDFNKIMKVYQKKMQDYQAANMDRMNAAQASNDQAAIDQIMKEFGAIQQEMSAASLRFPETHPKSYISVLIVNNMFSDPSNDIEAIRSAFDKLDNSLKKSKTGMEIQTRINNTKAVAVGNKAPEFSAPNPEGKMVSLKSSLGKITIIDFWASWCGPCRRENPNVVAVYNEFHSKGLNIISVSLDKDADKWKEAIAKDNLSWTHVSNLKFWQEPIAELYNVKSVPATFILDAKGKIVARDLRGDELKAKVAELLAK